MILPFFKNIMYYKNSFTEIIGTKNQEPNMQDFIYFVKHSIRNSFSFMNLPTTSKFGRLYHPKVFFLAVYYMGLTMIFLLSRKKSLALWFLSYGFTQSFYSSLYSLNGCVKIFQLKVFPFSHVMQILL